MRAEGNVVVERFPHRALKKVKIDYEWTGMGEPVKVEILIQNADQEPKVTVKGTPAGVVNTTLPVEFVQALGTALGDLLPLQGALSLIPCTDTNPNWKVTLTFEEGATLELVTQGSNFLRAGGPFQTEIDGQVYAQYSADFLVALSDIFDSLELEFGIPAGSFCTLDAMADVLDQAYP